MINKIFFITIFLSVTVSAQPYYYYFKYYPANQGHSYSGDVLRLNLSNGLNELFLSDAGPIYGDIYINKDQSRLFFQRDISLEQVDANNQPPRIIDILPSINTVINIKESLKMNRYYFSLGDSDELYSKTIIVNHLTSQPVDTIYEDYTDYYSFLSHDEERLYQLRSDSSGIYFSTFTINSKQRSIKRRCGSLGPFASLTGLNEAKDGLALVSYETNNADDFSGLEYVLCDVDNNISYNPIKYAWRSEGKFSYDEKYVILQRVDYDPTRESGEYRPGSISVFDAHSGAFIKELTFPPEGKILLFDSYPNMLYYYLHNEQRSINIDLSKLAPPSGCNVKLINSTGSILTSGALQYYEGSWKDAINNNDGTFTITTSAKTLSLRMTYEYDSQTKSNVPVGNDTIVFQTINAQIKLQNSQGNPIDTGTVQYYAGAWRNLGSTTSGIASKELLPGSYSFRMTYAYASKDKQQDIGANPTVIFQTVNAAVQLQNSLNSLIDQGTVQYYSGAWRDFGTTINGVANKELLPNNYSFRMTYAFASKDKQQDLSSNTVVVFQTVKAIVQLQNSLGNLIDQGTVQYYSGAWRDFGTTSNGTVSKELLPNSYSFRMTYAFASKDKQQDIGVNPMVVFQTINAAVQLQNSLGNLIDQGVVQYYSGAWRDFGTTSNGTVSKELLPNSYSFRMTYAFASKDKQQDIGVNPMVVFQTVNATVQLQNSLGNLIDQGVVQYYSGAWRDFGTTSNGTVSKELLPNSYSFRMTYAFASKDKQQDIGVNPTVVFQTLNAKVQLQNSQGNLIDQGTVQYYSGAWRTLGTTSNGVATKELLPNNYSFRMTYEFVSNDKTQDLSTNGTVNFPTVLCTVRVKNSQNQPVDNALASYYSGAWRQIGSTVNGEITKELLPANLSFRVKLGTVQQDKTQNLSTSSVVEFVVQP